MALNRKYAALPDLDSAPDIYETPDLTDDNSTVPGTTLLSPSDAASDEDTADEDGGISRQKLRINEARSKFGSTRYNSAGVDFSDRVDSKRRSYRTRRHRVLEDGTEELGDLSDEDNDTDDAAESLERKIARLKREVEEAKEECTRRRAGGGDAGSRTGSNEEGQELESLGRVLEEISRPSGVARPSRLSKPLLNADESSAGPEATEATYTVTYAPNYEQSHALAKAAEFDQRLLALERSLGIGTTMGLDMGANGLPRAVLPTVNTLNKQISVLAKASTANLDSISRRVRTLVTDIESLNKAKAMSKPADQPNIARYVEERIKEDSKGKDAVETARTEEDEQRAKINALYGTLATIENLAPLLQPLLDRLRSLRAIHADAATASETLDRIEKQQADTATELKQWKDGLEKIAQAMDDGSSVMEGNMKVMETWVKDLEGRIKQLSA